MGRLDRKHRAFGLGLRELKKFRLIIQVKSQGELVKWLIVAHRGWRALRDPPRLFARMRRDRLRQSEV